jgi:hypothetical protein
MNGNCSGGRRKKEAHMPIFKVFPWLFGLLALIAAGCSPLHTQARPGFDWTAASDIVLHSPASDPWGLVAQTQQELQGMGYVLQPPTAPDPDLVIKFSWQEGPDFTSDGTLVNRPKSLHLQFVDPCSGALVAVVDYFLRSSEEPAAGLKAAFAGLRRELQASRSASTLPARVLVPAPVQPPTQPVEVPAAEPATGMTATPAATVVSEKSADRAAPLPVPSVPQQTAPPPNSPPLPAPQPASQPLGEVDESPRVEAPEPIIKPMERSPWLPKFKSWGFEEWGKPDKGEL